MPVACLGKGLVGLALILATAEAAFATELLWESLAEGFEVTVWTPDEGCQAVPPLYVVRIDPEHFRFAVYHYRTEGLASPLTLEDWLRRTGARALFNAGLFGEDFTYLGLLYKEGRPIGGRRHGQWQGLFVAEPFAPGARKARVLDLRVDPFVEERPAYQEAAQSLMLLDREGTPRVRRSGKAARQTVVGEDRDGRLLVIMSKGPTPLWELAVCLRDEFGAISHAMAMDGGASSDVLISPELAGARSKKPWWPLVDGQGRRHIPLPTVIAVFPRGEPASDARPK
jgi:uncharacterized protein YigE (DUF2233 family)